MDLIELKKILDTMVVPSKRKELTMDNLRWLKRNLFIQNSAHPEFAVAEQLIVKLIKLYQR